MTDQMRTSTKQVIAEMQRAWIAKLTPEQQQIVADFKDAAIHWREGRLPLGELKRISGDGWLRNKIVRNITVDDPAYEAVAAFLDACMAESEAAGEGIRTEQGWLSRADIEAAGGRMEIRTNETTGELRWTVVFDLGGEVRDARTKPDPFATTSARSPFAADWG